MPAPVVAPTSTPQSARRDALAALRAATWRLHHAAARAHAAGLFDDDDFRLLRAELKRGRYARGMTPAAITARARRYTRQAEEYQAQTPAGPAETRRTEPGPGEAGRRAAPAPREHGGAVASPPRSPAGPPPAARPTPQPAPARRVDETGAQQAEGIARRYSLVCKILGGTSVEDALAETGLEYTPRAARYIVKRYRALGYDGLRDHRRGTKPRDRRVMTPAVEKVVFATWFEHAAARPKAVWTKVVAACKRLKLPVPKYHSVWRYLDKRPEREKLLRAGKLETIAKEHTAVVRFQMARRANERFQIDHTQLKLWGKKRDERGVLVPTRVWCTSAIDECSRSIAGFVLSTEPPNAWQVALMLRQAMLPKPDPRWLNKGKPEVIQPDRGMDFMSDNIAVSCAALGIKIDPDPPHYPNRKGKKERWYQTLDAGCIRLLPGHKATGCVSEAAAAKRVDGLLFVHEIRAEIERWVVEDYHVRTHRTIGCAPVTRWEQTVGVPLMAESEDALNLLLLQTEERTVQNVGIEFRKECYWSPVLASCIKRKVTLRYDPDDDASVLVYDAVTTEFLCEAFVMGRPASLYATGDVQRAAREAHAGLLARTKDRMDQTALAGRTRDAERTGRDLADALRRNPAAPTAAEAAAAPRTRAEADALLARLKAADGDETPPIDGPGAAAPGALERAAADVQRRLEALADDAA